MRYRMLATYRGVPYEAGVGPSGADVVLFAACPPPEELGFEPATGHWRKRVIRAEIDALWESRPVGNFRDEPCLVLDDLGDRLHIAYLGTDAQSATRLGYWQIDRGVFELLTPREDVTGLTEERVDRPLRLDPAAPGPGPGHDAGPGWPYTGAVQAPPQVQAEPAPSHAVPTASLAPAPPLAAQAPADPLAAQAPTPPLDAQAPAHPPAAQAPPHPLAAQAPPPPFAAQGPAGSRPIPDAPPRGAPAPEAPTHSRPPPGAHATSVPGAHATSVPGAHATSVPGAHATSVPGAHSPLPGTHGFPGPEAQGAPFAEVRGVPGMENGGRAARRQRVATRDVFCELADLAAIPRAAYALEAEVDGALCLLPTSAGYEVFVSADGARHEARSFQDEEAAYFYLFGVLAAEAVRNGMLTPAGPRDSAMLP